MAVTIALLLFYFLTPVLIIYLTHISKTINKIGAVVLAYAVGLLIGNIGILPRASDLLKSLLAGKAALPHKEITALLEAETITRNDFLANQISSIQDLTMSLVIIIAIPLMIFSLDLKRWLKLAREAFKSLILGLVSLIIVVFTGYFLLGNVVPESWKVAGMLVGVYTGGSPNLAAIGTALEVSPNIFILTNTYDMVLGALCLFFLLSYAQRLFNKFLPHFSETDRHIKVLKIVKESEGIDNYLGMLNKKAILKLLLAFALSLVIVAVGFGLSQLVPKNAEMTTLILTITTLALAISMIKWINQMENTFQLGMYFIIVFSLIIASQANLSSMFQISFLPLFLFVAIAVFGSMIIHVGLSWIFKVDTDTTIITIAALTYSPPFVPVVAAALKNKEVIITGLTTGILGYAFGNYLGITIAYLLKSF